MPDTSAIQTGLRVSDEPIQELAPFNSELRFEGVAFSSSGDTLAVVASDRETVFLYRRLPDGTFEERPFSFLPGMSYPHDASFTTCGDLELLAVAMRTSAVAIYMRPSGAGYFEREPVCVIDGSRGRLNFSDAIAFVPPANDHLAVCNLVSNNVLFYEWSPGPPPVFKEEPVYEIKHASISSPDGLAFSTSGRWLAVANHDGDTVTVFERLGTSSLEFAPKPVAVISDKTLRYPHSVAFASGSDHLFVTNAGANYFSVYAPQHNGRSVTWKQTPILQKAIGSETVFKELNSTNKMEGGPKGVACNDDTVAICCPGRGVRIYTFETGADLRA